VEDRLNFSFCYLPDGILWRLFQHLHLLYSIKEEPQNHKIKSFSAVHSSFLEQKALTVWLLLESQTGKQKKEEFSV
jgi:hypothetical protein